MKSATNMDRRSFLELAGGASMLGLALSGCSTYTDDDEGSSSGSAGTSDASTETESAGGGELFTIVGTQPNTLNMIQSTSNLDKYAFYLTQEMLFRPYNGTWEPEVVDSYEVSDDGLTYTYTLKETTWSDGTAITAADFAYYLTAQLDPSNASANASSLISNYHFLNAESYNAGECTVDEVGIQATDDTTLVFTLDRVVADFDGTNILCYPLSADFVAEEGEALGGTAEDYMNSGPYVLSSWVYDSELIYDKSDTYLYADDKFLVEQVDWLNKNDDNAAITMFESGECDCIMEISDEGYTQLNDYITEFPGGSVKCLQFNVYGQGDEAKAALLSNKNFRMALSYAIDRESVAQAASSLYTGINRYLIDPVKGNSDDTLFEDDYPVETVPMEGDTDAALEYLEAALDELGYSSVDELPEITYLTFESDAYSTLAELLVDQWKQILGITNITIELQPVADAITSMMSYQYDIYYTALSLSIMPSEFMNYWVTGGSVNDITATGVNLWENEEYDSLIEAAGTETDRETRMGYYAEAEQLLIDELPVIPINTETCCAALADNVSGYMFNALDQAVEIDYLSVE